MSDEIFVSGIGLKSKFGSTPDSFWNSLITCNDHGERAICTDIISDELYQENYENYFIDMCTDAIIRAANEAGVDLNDGHGCVILGTGMGLADSFLYEDKIEPDFMSSLDVKIKEKLHTNVSIIIIANACCSSAQAIAFGYDLLMSKEYTYVIAGGVEAYSYITQCGFQRLNAIDKNGCKPFDKDRKGIHIGDGAVFFTLMSVSNKHSYCKLLGHGNTNDAYHIVAPDPTGQYIKNAILTALNYSKIIPNEIDAVVTHGTGTKANDQVEAEALYELFGEIDITAPKGKIGHIGGASGAFGILTAILMLQHQKIPPVVNLNEIDSSIKVNPVIHEGKKKRIRKLLVNCFGFGGTNTVLVCGEAAYEKEVNIKKQVALSEHDFRNSNFSPPNQRTIDDFSRKVLYATHELFCGNLYGIDNERTGAVISTRTGPSCSLKKTSDLIKQYDGYQGVNPSFFPNVMLSTALFYLTNYLDIHGPTCTFYEHDKSYNVALKYCKTQILRGYCDTMIMITANENGWAEGKLISRKG